MKAALRNQQALPSLGQITNDLLGARVNYRGAHRNGKNHVLALGAGTVTTTTILAALGVKAPRVAVVHQGIEIDVSFQKDGAAIATVAAIRAAFGDELLTPKAHAAITTITSLDRDGYLINKFHSAPLPERDGLMERIRYKQKSPVARQGFLQSQANQAVTTLT